MSDLSDKFSELQSQLAAQHVELMNLLGLMRLDLYDMKQDVDNIRISAANTATFSQQINQGTTDIYNRLQTLNDLYSYLTTDRNNGGDLLSRIADLQTNVNDIEGFAGETWSAVEDVLTQLTLVRVSVAPNAQSSLYTRTNAITNNTNAMRLALLGDRSDSAWPAMAKTLLDVLNALEPIESGISSIDGGIVSANSSLSALVACSCPPEPDICDTGTPLNTMFVDSGIPANVLTVRQSNGAVETLMPPGSAFISQEWLPLVNSGGTSSDYIQWNTAQPGIVSLSGASFCLDNGSGFDVWVRILDITELPSSLTSVKVDPGTRQHFYGHGPLTYAAFTIVGLASTADLGAVKIDVFAAG